MKIIFRVGMSRVEIMLSICLIFFFWGGGGSLIMLINMLIKKLMYQSFGFTTVK